MFPLAMNRCIHRSSTFHSRGLDRGHGEAHLPPTLDAARPSSRVLVLVTWLALAGASACAAPAASGESRSVSSIRKDLIKDWLVTYSINHDHLKLFETEYLFTEGSAKYWIPVQKQLIEHFDKELKREKT